MAERLYYTPEDAETNGGTKAQFLEYKLALEYINPEDRVLDLGCGGGGGAALIATKASHVDAVDKAAIALGFARENNSKDNITYWLSPAETFDSSGSLTWDVILMIDFLEHVRDPKFMVKRYYERLNSGGRMIIAAPEEDPTKPHEFHLHPLDIPSLEEYLERLPYIVRRTTLFKEPYDFDDIGTNLFVVVTKP